MFPIYTVFYTIGLLSDQYGLLSDQYGLLSGLSSLYFSFSNTNECLPLLKRTKVLAIKGVHMIAKKVNPIFCW